jgi:hypothetical protein
MIPAVDKALEGLIRREALSGATDVDVSFEAPTTEWAARRNGPSVNLYLYDIREDTSRRQTTYENVRDEAGIVTARRPPPRRFKLNYLLTAWTQRPEDEHRLLSSCLGCLVTHDTMPEDLLTGPLTDLGSSLVTVALPAGGDRAISEIWTALGGELKPSLDLQINAPYVTGQERAVGPPVREEPSIEIVTADGTRERPSRVREAYRSRFDKPARKAGDEDLAELLHGSGAVISGSEVPEGAAPGRWIRTRG